MTHLELENLTSDYLEGLLDTVRRAQVEAHLAECTSCRELVADVRNAIDLCHKAEVLEPSPWLVSRILLATVGGRKPAFWEQVAAFFRPALQPRVAYVVAMAVFSFSIIVNAAGINLRNFTVQDLRPTIWYSKATRTGHLLVARAEKFYYDLRVVYEIESRFRQLRSEPEQQEKEAPKDQTPGGSTDTRPANNPQMAWVVTAPGSAVRAETPLDFVDLGRSPSR
jgi:hypothetical protein